MAICFYYVIESLIAMLSFFFLNLSNFTGFEHPLHPGAVIPSRLDNILKVIPPVLSSFVSNLPPVEGFFYKLFLYF